MFYMIFMQKLVSYGEGSSGYMQFQRDTIIIIIMFIYLAPFRH